MDNPYRLEDLYPETPESQYADVRRAVELGGAYMDGRASDWLDIVELDGLDLNNMNVCVMGQVLGPFAYSRELNRRGMRWVMRHGFLDHRSALLTAAWKEYIWNRRADEAQRAAAMREEGDD